MNTQALKSTILLMLIGILCAPVSAAILYVDADASPGGDGSSWANAFDTIQEAIDASSNFWIICYAPPTSIYVRQGTYSLSSQIDVDKVVSLYGGFPSSIANPTMADRNWQSYRTTINGNNTVRCLNVTSHCVIDGFYIQNGYTTGSGGGIYFKSRPYECSGIPSSYWISGTIRNCDFNSNDASSGGAIYLPTTINPTTGSDPTISNCTFRSNTADTGGAIYMVYSAPNIEQCTFRQNQSLASGSLGGGAIGGFSHNYTTGKYMNITNCLFYLNTSASWGGAFSGNQTYPTITNCTFADNSATNAGGAFHGNMNSEAPRLRNSICWGNSPDQLDIVTASTYLNVSYCDIEGGWTGPGSNNLNADPDFNPKYKLFPGSPCIDTGSNGYAPNEDLEGTTRPLDGDDNGTATADMGAFEMPYSDVDLRALSIFTDPAIPIVGQPVTVKVSARNYGTTDSASCWLDWYANEATAPGVNNLGNRYWSVSIPALTTVTKETTYTYTTAGDIKMYAQIDTGDHVIETNETNNVYGPRSNRAVLYQPLDYAIRAEEGAASMYFGGDDNPRNVGVGQSITPVRTAKVSKAGFRFNSYFDYATNPEYTGHQVTLYMYVREADGSTVTAAMYSVPASFNGGWIMFPFNNLWLEAGQQYIFTCFVFQGEYNQLKNSVAGHSSNPWPGETGYVANVYGQPASMTTWSNWGTHSWDFNFRMEGQYLEPYPGDFDEDRSAGLGDLASLAGYWLADDCLMPDWCERCDVNWDSHVQLQDFNVLSRFWGNTYYDYDDLNKAAIESLESEMSSANINGSDGNEFKPGTYFIYKTDMGKYGKFIVEDFDKADLNKLTIAWVTYYSSGAVASSGSGLVIRGSYLCGLDSGREYPALDTGSDFWWYQGTSSKRYLDPVNGAIFKMMYRAP